MHGSRSKTNNDITREKGKSANQERAVVKSQMVPSQAMHRGDSVIAYRFWKQRRYNIHGSMSVFQGGNL